MGVMGAWDALAVALVVCGVSGYAVVRLLPHPGWRGAVVLTTVVVELGLLPVWLVARARGSDTEGTLGLALILLLGCISAGTPRRTPSGVAPTTS